MATREDWLQAFEAVNGRKPTPQEFQAAKATNFDTAGLLPEAAPAAQAQAPVEKPAAPTAAQAPASEAAAPTENPAAQQTAQVNPTQAAPVNPAAAAAAAAGVAPTAQAQAVANGQKKASIIPAIIILILSVLFFILALVIPVPIAWVFLALSLATMGAGIFFFIMNVKKSGKLLSIIAFGVSIFFFLASAGAIVVKQTMTGTGGPSTAATSSDNSGKDSTDIDEYVDEDSNNFKWTEKDFRDLKFSDKYAGTRLTDVVKKFGKASSGNMSSDSIMISYYNGSDYDKSVQLYFNKDDDGHYVLSSGSASNLSEDDLPVNPVGYGGNASEWTKSDYDALKEGESDDKKSGTKLSEVTDKHGKPTTATLTLSNYGDGFEESLQLYYSSSSNDKMSYVSLGFTKVDDTYYLTYKSGDEE